MVSQPDHVPLAPRVALVGTYVTTNFGTENYLSYPHIRVGMATKNISITVDAYDRLATLRQGNESFSEIIKRLTHARNIMQFAGILSKQSADDMEKNIALLRASNKKNLKERAARMRKQMK